MEVKKFEAYTMQDAIKAVKSHFGNDAVILNSREKFGNSGADRMFEITATAPMSVKGGGVDKMGASSFDKGLYDLTAKVDRLDAKIGVINSSLATREHVSNIEASLRELKTIVLEVLKSKDGAAFKDLDKPLSDLVKQMQIMGVNEGTIAQLVRFLKNLDKDGKDEREEVDKAEYYKIHAIKWMLKRIKIAPSFVSPEDGCLIHTFVGGAGVGKTTSIAKLAALLFLREKMDILLVSYDNGKLAAAEQLKIYAKVVGIPFERIASIDELDGVISRHSNCRMVLLDTSSKSIKGVQGFSEYEMLQNMNIPVEFHLVMSATEKEEQMDKAIRAFTPLGISSLLFTKLDDTWCYGEIFNLAAKWGIPLSYFGVGQNVPDDVERASRERVIERIFGL